MPEPVRSNTDLSAATNLPVVSDDTQMVSGGTSPSLAFAPAAVPGEVGCLGPYRILKQLGKGGMGAVYLALDTRLDRQVALKVMLPKFAADPVARGRFLREAKAAAKINHDNVVTVHEADERDGVPYIAMQLLQGASLDEYLKTRGLPTIPQVLRIARDAASGLAAAHAIGMVHRDVKPANLWLEAPNGRVKVLDFGLARPLDVAVEVTQSGAVVGTPAYMSPEQARGVKFDHRTDLFSLGATLYHLCTGQRPFEGESVTAVVIALATEDPQPVRELNPLVPEGFAALIHQLLEKKPDNRPQTADEVVRRVDGLIAGPQPVLDGTAPQVVYVPIQMTTTSMENNAFADLDATESEPGVARAGETKPARQKPRGKGLWVAAGFAAVLAAVAVGGVIIIIKNKDGTETKIEVPDDATVTIKGKDGKELAKVGPETKGGKTDPVVKKPADPDLRDQVAGARWLLENKKLNVIGIEQDGKRLNIHAGTIPAGPFRVWRLDFHPANNGGQLKEEDVHRLAVFTDLEELLGPDRALTDAGLESLRPLKNLRRLDTIYSRATPAGAKVIRQFPKLEYLIGPGDDEWLKNLAGMPTIRVLDFYRTALSGGALDGLKGFPNLTEIVFDEVGLPEDGLKKLAGVKTLRLLTLRDMPTKPEQAKQLAEAMPWCEIRLAGGGKATTFNEGRADPDRRVAEWVLSLGGSVRVKGGDREIKATAELPKGRFALSDLSLQKTPVTDDDLARLRGAEVAKLDLGETKVTGAGLVHLQDLKGLKNVSLHYAAITDAGLPYLANIETLEHVWLGATKVTDAGLPRFRDFKALTGLGLSGTQITNAGLMHLKDLKGLRRLWLGFLPVTDAGLAHLKDLKNLTELDLTKTQVTAKGVQELHDALPGCRILWDGGVLEAVARDRPVAEWVLSLGGSVRVDGAGADLKTATDLPRDRKFALTRVDLEATSVTAKDLQNLIGLDKLGIINLNYTTMTDAGLEHLSGLTSLSALLLEKTKVSDSGLVHLKKLSQLDFLNLNGTQVTDAGVAHLKSLTGLKVLWLRETQVTDAGVPHLKSLTGLEDLWLNGTQVTDAGLARLTELKELSGLDVRKTKVTAKGVADFHAALPACRISWDKGTIEPKK